jgi:hypothetical protein
MKSDNVRRIRKGGGCNATDERRERVGGGEGAGYLISPARVSQSPGREGRPPQGSAG